MYSIDPTLDVIALIAVRNARKMLNNCNVAEVNYLNVCPPIFIARFTTQFCDI